MDAEPLPDMVQSGNFDLSGMLAALDAQIKKMRARRIVCDALDIVLALLPDPAAKTGNFTRSCMKRRCFLIRSKFGWGM